MSANASVPTASGALLANLTLESCDDPEKASSPIEATLDGMETSLTWLSMNASSSMA